jgi:hypothetical protein
MSKVAIFWVPASENPRAFFYLSKWVQEAITATASPANI